MSRLALGAILLTAAVALAAPALAGPIFADDFQDGQADGWGAAGAGDVRLTTFQGNVSLRLTRRAMATTSVSTRGFAQVSVAAALAGQGLGRDDACLAEVSADDGATWREIVALRDGADDGVAFTHAEVSAPVAADRSTLMIRFRAAGGLRALCWGDAVVVTGQPLAAEPGAPGALFDHDQLISGEGFSSPLPLSAFAPPPGAEAPSSREVWRLTLDSPAAKVGMAILKDETATTAATRALRATLPTFDFVFVEDGEALIPVQRGPIASGHPVWEWVLETGRVWTEAADRGWRRAAMPFALQERNANCLHNGVMTFLFKPDGSVSRVAFEVASETCAYLKFDAWGMVPARLTAVSDVDADAIAAAYRAEVAARLPVRPIAALANLYPGLDPARLVLAPPADGDPPTAYGLVVDGVHHASTCQTRHGDYPFCNTLDLPSYSTAKSIVGAIGLMRLEALVPGAANQLIAEHVSACAAGEVWKDVTLGQSLDMATGVYGSSAFEADESAPSISAFFDAEDHAAKVAYACGQYGRRATPGQTFVYHTADTYLLGAALADIQRERGDGDFYDALIAPLWRSLRLSPTILTTRRTLDSIRQPFTGWGLTYHADDIARIGGWLSDGARIDGRTVLDPGLLSAALQRDPARPGLRAGGEDYRYKAGFWARDLGTKLGCAAPLWVPFMSGYGGISVVLLPGGLTYYYFGDSGVFDWAQAAVETAKIKRMCP